MLMENGIDPNADVFDGAQSLDPSVVSALDGGDVPVGGNDALLDDSDSFDNARPDRGARAGGRIWRRAGDER